ncbi:hypothetical protein GCM10010313_27220 [Streptomyces violarus]|uniref:Uncharacterized protein n=1 Tax=Streptomyces violarus TaxID=67380 RepID=A0A7W5F5J4_9ACTN|nr:hypothetical protein [Streptomyces violarus]MBB3080925.1 hypothetical protein [Streptomyces violarus]GHD07712.1 hypothetical protein GCM10010313_27220 [Streptomyces violarus]
MPLNRTLRIIAVVSVAFGVPLAVPEAASAQVSKEVRCTVTGNADKGMCTPEPGYLTVGPGKTLRVTLHHDSTKGDVNFEAYDHANSRFLGESVDIDAWTGPPNITVWRNTSRSTSYNVYVMADPDPHFIAVSVHATYAVS